MHQYHFRKSTRTTKNQGAILALVIVVIFIMIILMVFAFDIWKLTARRQDSQTITNAIVLEGASLLNANDCIGRTNNLVALSRELVFDSRMIHTYTSSPYYFIFEPLARQLLDGAKHGAWLLDIGRTQVIATRLKELCQMVNSNAELTARGARVVDLEVGYILDDRQSSAYDDSADELQAYDVSQSYIDKKTRRFKGNINAKLSGDDANQVFKLSSLRTLSRGSIQQARLVNATDFVKTAKLIENGKTIAKVFCDQMPCAVKLRIAFPIEQGAQTGTSTDKKNSAEERGIITTNNSDKTDTNSKEKPSTNGKEILVQATAVTSGAQPEP